MQIKYLYTEYVERSTKIFCLLLYWLIKISLQYFANLFLQKKYGHNFFKITLKKVTLKKLHWRILWLEFLPQIFFIISWSKNSLKKNYNNFTIFQTLLL